MTWLSRLKNVLANDILPTKTTKTNFVVSVGATNAFIHKHESRVSIPNDFYPVLDRYSWPHSLGMINREIDIFTSRVMRLTGMGIGAKAAVSLADRLLTRDRDADDRILCLECKYLRKGWRCSNWARASVANRAIDSNLPTDFVSLMQRCDGFNQVI